MKNGLIYIFVLISIIALAAPTKKQLALLKNDVVAVKATLKTGKDLSKSEATVRKYLADSIYTEKRPELQELLCEVLKKAYQLNNEKLYLKVNADDVTGDNVKVDTTELINTGCRMFQAYQQMDSQNNKERKKNSLFLLPYRTNIFMGGLYFLHKKDWKQAWQCFDIYLQCANEPLFSQCDIHNNDSISYKVAFLSLVAASHMDSLSYAMKYAPLSVLSNHREKALELLADMTHNHKDSADYEHFLREGFHDFPQSEYFFPHLIDLLDDKGVQGDAIALCEQALQIDSLNTMFLLAKHSLLMNTKQYDEAVRVGEKVIALNDSIDTPYYNIGFVYHMRAMETLNTKGKPYRQRLQAAQKLFRRCRTYMERYRKLAPLDRIHWRPILYDVYLNLNMGKEFAEIENCTSTSLSTGSRTTQ